MIWYEHLFLGKKCRKNFGRLKHKITNGQAHSGVYLIVLPKNEHALLEIIPSMLLVQEYYPAKDLRIVGAAATRREAFSLVEKILGNVYKSRGNVNEIASYLEQYR